MNLVPHYLVLDIETTGLDPQKDVILEIGVILVSKTLEHVIVHPDGARQAREISWVLAHDRDFIWNKMNETCRAMHTKNGLIEECRLSTTKLWQVEETLLDHVIPQFPEKPVLLGSTIDFDKGFLKEHMPKFHSQLHYRKVDVTGPKLLIEGITGKKFKKAEAHRSLPDCRESLEHARIIREVLQEGLHAFESAGYHSPLHGVLQ